MNLYQFIPNDDSPGSVDVKTRKALIDRLIRLGGRGSDYLSFPRMRDIFSARVVNLVGDDFFCTGQLIEASPHYFHFIPPSAEFFDIEASEPVYGRDLEARMTDSGIEFHEVPGCLIGLRRVRLRDGAGAFASGSAWLPPPFLQTLYGREFVVKMRDCGVVGYWLCEWSDGASSSSIPWYTAALERVRNER